MEDAAEAIGANPLLARSCAYYHDIGKGRNPLYFGENQKGENRHDTLAPAMSAVIIKRHVTEGMEMARQYKLPKLVADAIPQHHGTRLVGYFFHKAMKEQEGKESPQPIDESIYRYPGPKPQFREAALVMIADAVEAASRSMPEPTTREAPGAGAEDHQRHLLRRPARRVRPDAEGPEPDRPVLPAHARGHLPRAPACTRPGRGGRGRPRRCALAGGGASAGERRSRTTRGAETREASAVRTAQGKA